MEIRKASDARFAKLAELQDYLRSRDIPFETDNNKPRLIEMVINSFNEPVKDTPPLDLTDVQPVGVEAKPAEPLAVEPPTEPAEVEPPEEELVPINPEPVEPPVAEPEPKKEVPKIKKGEETVNQADDRLATPGARRTVPLQELLAELARKGVSNKEDLANLLEAQVRERKALEEARALHTAREEAIVAGELKLDQRIKDNEVIFAQVHEHKQEAAEMLEKAMKLRQ